MPILTPGFLKWDGLKYVLDPDIAGTAGPTITNNGVGLLPNVTSTVGGASAEIIAFTGISDMTVSGFTDGTESRQIKIFNTNSAATLTLKHLDGSSVLANQIITPGGVDFALEYQESVMLIYSIVDFKWRVTEKEDVIGGGSGTPGGTNQQVQFNNNGAFGGVTNWNTTGSNRIHINYKLMTGGPALEFLNNTITRGFGSWEDDGFTAGDLFSLRGPWYDNGNVPQTPLNIVNATITNVTPSVLTISSTITPAGYALAGETFGQGGGLLTGGSSVALLPDSGIIRIPQPNNFTDTEVITVRDSGGDTVPIISVSESVELMIGGTFNESNLAAGVTNRRPSTIAMWGGFNLDFTDERVWREDKGSYTNFLSEFRARVQTTNATPTQLISKNVSSLQSYAFIELYVVASKNFPVDQGATWKFTGALTSGSFDWRTASYHTNTAGASTWTCVVTGDATITVTGQAGTTINWRVYGRFI